MCRLRVLNGTKNQLTSLPSLNNNPEQNNVKELYLSGNELGNDVLDVVAGYTRLQILHLAYNQLTELYDRQVTGWLVQTASENFRFLFNRLVFWRLL